MPEAKTASGGGGTEMKNSTGYAGLLSLTLAVSAVLGVPALAQGMGDAAFVNVKDTKWGDAPPTLPKGAKLAVLTGDPGKPAPFTMRLMMPANYNLAPHWHTQDENLTIVSGAFYIANGRQDREGDRRRPSRPADSISYRARRTTTRSRRRPRSFRYTASGRSTSTISTPRTIRSRRVNRLQPVSISSRLSRSCRPSGPCRPSLSFLSRPCAWRGSGPAGATRRGARLSSRLSGWGTGWT